jgi:hypothetical protein
MNQSSYPSTQKARSYFCAIGLLFMRSPVGSRWRVFRLLRLGGGWLIEWQIFEIVLQIFDNHFLAYFIQAQHIPASHSA